MTNGLINPGHNLRLRVFGGPNGSGKSTVIKSVRDYKINGVPLSFGAYVNADDIAKKLRQQTFNFTEYSITATHAAIIDTALNSGMIGKDFNRNMLENSFSLGSNGSLQLIDGGADERLAQILADYLRKCLLDEKKKFSFETVFSHASKLQIMRDAAAMGYKVYLYFVSTEAPEINKSRVLERTAQGGHNVPVDKIESRYFRSLDLMFDAAQIAYQAFFFDNSVDGAEGRMFAHFKIVNGEKHWDSINRNDIPNWFKKYYAAKVK